MEHRDRVALAIAANDTLGLATDQNASYLVEKAMGRRLLGIQGLLGVIQNPVVWRRSIRSG